MSGFDDLEIPVARDTRLGATVRDRYKILRRLGEGGMGAVYEAEHLLIKRKVAIKTLHPHLSRNPDMVARFRREALAATATRNEHVIEVTDMGQFDDDGALFIVLELLNGRNLAEEMESSGPLPLGRAARIMCQVCDALEVLHAQGIVHRDLKPENLFLVTRSDNADFIKILDFGISKLRVPRDDGPTNLTDEGVMLGTAHFMSPEQARGDRDVDHRTDLYALGGILYHMLTGAYPFDADTLPMLFVKLHTEAPPPIELRRSDLPPLVGETIRRCLAKKKEERIQSAAELRAVLAPMREVEAPPSLLPEAYARKRLRSRWTAIGAALALALLAALGSRVLRPGAETRLRTATTQVAVSAAANASPAAQERAPAIRLRLWTTPAQAELFLDGEPIPNPFDDMRSPDDREHLVEARAPGFQPASKSARFTAPLNLRLVLAPEVVAVTPASAPRPRRAEAPALAPEPPPAASTPPPAPEPPPAAPAAPASSSRKRLLGERQLLPVKLD